MIFVFVHWHKNTTLRDGEENKGIEVKVQVSYVS